MQTTDTNVIKVLPLVFIVLVDVLTRRITITQASRVWLRRPADPVSVSHYRRPGALPNLWRPVARLPISIIRVVTGSPPPGRDLRLPIESVKLSARHKAEADNCRQSIEVRVRNFLMGPRESRMINPVLDRFDLMVKRIFGYFYYQDHPELFGDRLDLVELYEVNSFSELLDKIAVELNLSGLGVDFPDYLLAIAIAEPERLQSILPLNVILELEGDYHHLLPAARFPNFAYNPYNIYKISRVLHAMIHSAIRMAFGSHGETAPFLLCRPAYNQAVRLNYLDQIGRPIVDQFGQPVFDESGQPMNKFLGQPLYQARSRFGSQQNLPASRQIFTPANTPPYP